jgi:hypothetical protein
MGSIVNVCVVLGTFYHHKWVIENREKNKDCKCTPLRTTQRGRVKQCGRARILRECRPLPSAVWNNRSSSSHRTAPRAKLSPNPPDMAYGTLGDGVLPLPLNSWVLIVAHYYMITMPPALTELLAMSPHATLSKPCPCQSENLWSPLDCFGLFLP